MSFDLVAGGLLFISGLMGYFRGATREISTVLALVLASVAAVFTLRFTGPMAQHAIHATWLADATAVMVVFIAVYVLLRLGGAALTRGVHQTGMSALDRILGFGVGLVRGVVVLGGFALLTSVAMPQDRLPEWYTGAKVYPLANAAGQALKSFAPEGVKLAHDLTRLNQPSDDTAEGGE